MADAGRGGKNSNDAMTTVCFVYRNLASMRSCTCLPLICAKPLGILSGWAEAPIKIARMTLTIKLDRNWNSFQLANSAPPLSVTDSAIAPSARMLIAFAYCSNTDIVLATVCFAQRPSRKMHA